MKEEQRSHTERRHDGRSGSRGKLGRIGDPSQPPERRNAEHDDVRERECKEHARADVPRRTDPPAEADGEIDDRRGGLRDAVDCGENRCGEISEIQGSCQLVARVSRRYTTRPSKIVTATTARATSASEA
jgi:hypothetical protein